MTSVSIVIAAKDCEKWLPLTIQSLLQQTYKLWECIISVNGSSDKTEEIANTIASQDKRFKTINSLIPNKSLAVNRAILNSKNDLIAILDADDLWVPKKIEHQLSVFLKGNIDILGTQLEYIDKDGVINGKSPILPILHEDCVHSLNYGNNPIANSSVLYRKSIHDEVGYYDPEKFAVEDYDMWLRCMRSNLRFSNLNERYLLHRIHNQSNFNSNPRQHLLKDLTFKIHQIITNIK